MKKVVAQLAATAIFIALVGFMSLKLQGKSISATPERKEIKIGDETILAEVADSEDERQKGLAGRRSLGENEGMLFVFEQKDVFPSFWMKGMQIPLDIIWIDNEKVVKIDSDVSPPSSDIPDSGLTLYHPGKPIDYVLEVASGFTEKSGIKVGDVVTIP